MTGSSSSSSSTPAYAIAEDYLELLQYLYNLETTLDADPTKSKNISIVKMVKNDLQAFLNPNTEATEQKIFLTPKVTKEQIILSRNTRLTTQLELLKTADLKDFNQDKLDKIITDIKNNGAKLKAYAAKAYESEYDESIYRKAESIISQIQPPDEPKTLEELRKLNQLGLIWLDKKNNYIEAIKCFSMILRSAKSISPPPSSSEIEIWNYNFAKTKHELAKQLIVEAKEEKVKYEEALALLKDSILIAKSFASTSIDIHNFKLNLAQTLNDLGGVFFNKENYKEALDCFTDLIAFAKTIDPPPPPLEIEKWNYNFAYTKYRLASKLIEEDKVKYDEALTLLKESILIVKSFSSTSSDIYNFKLELARTLNNLGVRFLDEEKNYNEAFDCFANLIAFAKTIDPPPLPSEIEIWNRNLAKTKCELAIKLIGEEKEDKVKYNEALALLKDTTAFVRTLDTSDSKGVNYIFLRNLVNRLYSLGNFFINKKQYQEAEICCDEAMSLADKTRSDISHENAGTLYGMAKFYYQNREYSKALKYAEFASEKGDLTPDEVVGMQQFITEIEKALELKLSGSHATIFSTSTSSTTTPTTKDTSSEASATSSSSSAASSSSTAPSKKK